MPSNLDPTVVHQPAPSLPETVVRPPAASSGDSWHRATKADGAGQQSGLIDFDEETRLLLRNRLIVAHAALAFATGVLTVLKLTGRFPIPAVGMPQWTMVLPILVLGQCLYGLYYLIHRPLGSSVTLRWLEVSQFSTFAIAGMVVRFLSLSDKPAASPDPRFHDLLYRFDAVLTNYPFVFAMILYGVLIPNTRRHSLVGVCVLGLAPMLALAAAAFVNPVIRQSFPTLLPVTMLPLVIAGVIAVFSASKSTTLRRMAFEARREAEQIGSYTLKRKLGEGGMGEVWLAEHRLLKRPCAVKFIRGEMAADPSTASRFEREVKAVTTLTHFNTIRVYDYGRTDEGVFYYVMEYLEGPTLDRLVKDGGRLPPGRAVRLIKQISSALAESHAAGMVHRDLKPGNIIVASLGGQPDVAKLLDFGLVQDRSEAADGERLTRTGVVLGTPAYMCPEQAAGSPVDHRGDLYSLGAVAFFALAGRPPFEAATVGQYLTAHLTQAAPSLTEIIPGISPDLAEIIARCLEKDPAKRFQSAGELEDALAPFEDSPT